MNINNGLRFIALIFMLSLWGCASAPQTEALQDGRTAAIPESRTLLNIPFFAQDEYQCGPAALATMLVANGLEVVPEELVSLVYIPGRSGSLQTELVAAARSFAQVAYELNPVLQDLLLEISAGHPVLVLQNLGLSLLPQWHFAVVVGFDFSDHTIILNSGTVEHYEMDMRLFERTWARGKHWSLTVLPAGVLPATADSDRYFLALADLESRGATQETMQTAYQIALQRWPDDRNFLMARGNLYYRNNEADLAIQTFKAVTVLYPDFAPAYNNLAWVLAESAKPGLGLPYIERAFELGGEDENTFQDTYRFLLEKIPAKSPGLFRESPSPM